MGDSDPACHEAFLVSEVGINAGAIAQVFPLNAEGWVVNSSFSNQRLYGWVAELRSGTDLSGGSRYPATEAGIGELLTELVCLQCRAVLMDWWRSPHAQPYRSATGRSNG